jgi:hypothetical protein
LGVVAAGMVWFVAARRGVRSGAERG